MNVLIRRRDAYLLLSQDLIAQLVQVVEFLVEAEYAKFNGEFVVEVPLGSERAYCCPHGMYSVTMKPVPGFTECEWISLMARRRMSVP